MTLIGVRTRFEQRDEKLLSIKVVKFFGFRCRKNAPFINDFFLLTRTDFIGEVLMKSPGNVVIFPKRPTKVYHRKGILNGNAHLITEHKHTHINIRTNIYINIYIYTQNDLTPKFFSL